MRVLFVDDEELVLEGLAGLLRRDRRRWDLAFAGSGPQALALMDRVPVDVLVTDVRMPEMNGEELLTIVCERHPQVARIVLSGHADERSSHRLVSLAHQFLAKPSSAGAIRAVIERAQRLAGLMADERLRAVVGRVGALPLPSTVLRELLGVLDDDATSLREAATVVEHEPALCARVVQTVNSAFFGLPTGITNVGQAVSYLGARTLRSLVLSLEVLDAFGPGATVAALDRVRARGVAAGGLAALIADDLAAPGMADDAFLAGMLHDAGLLVVAARLPAELAEVRGRVARGDASEEEAERQVLGVSHAEIGAYLLGLWGLPYPVVDAVAHHRHPSQASGPDAQVLTAVHVAVALLAERGAGDLALDDAYLDALGLTGRPPAWRGLVPKAAA